MRLPKHKLEAEVWPWPQRSAFWSLLRIQRRIGWRRAIEQMGGSSRSKWSSLLVPLIAVALIPSLAMLFGLVWAVQAGYTAIGQPHTGLTIAFLGAQVVCLVFGIGYIVSAFYFDTESKLLVSLPLKPETIAAARFWRVLSGEYWTISLFVVPFLVAYVAQVRPGPSFWLAIGPIFLLLPVVPLALSGIVAVGFMGLTAGRASRDAVRTIGFTAMMLVVVGVSIVMQRLTGQQFSGVPTEELLEAITSGRLDLAEMAGKFVPTTIWATRSLTGAPGASMYFLYYVLAAAVACGVLYVWTRRFLMAPLMEGEGTGRRRRRTVSLAAEFGRTRSSLVACVWREAVLLWRAPMFLMNALVGTLLLPILVVLPFVVNRELYMLFQNMSGPTSEPRLGIIFGCLGLLVLGVASSGLGSTAISREGRLFWLSRSLPISPRTQALAKQIWATAWASLGTIVVVIGGTVIVGFSFAEALLVLLGGFLIGWIVNGLGLVVDMIRPNLTWTDPQQAMKGNWNSVITLFLIVLLCIVLAAVVLVLALFAPAYILPTLFMVLCLGAWLVWSRLGPLAERQYGSLER